MNALPGERLWKSFNSIYFSLLYSAPCTLLMTNGSNIYLQICSFNNVNNLIPDYFSFISLGLRMMVNTLLASMKMLWDVLILTMFFICIFALVGMQVFVGVLRNKCAEPVPDNLQTSYIDYVSNSSEWLMSRLLFLFIVHSTLVNLLSVTEYVYNEYCRQQQSKLPTYASQSDEHERCPNHSSFQTLNYSKTYW